MGKYMQTKGHTFLLTHGNCSLLFDADDPDAFEVTSVSGTDSLPFTLFPIHEMTRCDTNCGTATPKIFFVSTSSSVVSDANWSKLRRNADTGDNSSAFTLSPPKMWWPMIFGWKFCTISPNNIYSEFSFLAQFALVLHRYQHIVTTKWRTAVANSHTHTLSPSNALAYGFYVLLSLFRCRMCTRKSVNGKGLNVFLVCYVTRNGLRLWDMVSFAFTCETTLFVASTLPTIRILLVLGKFLSANAHTYERTNDISCII